MVDGVHRHTAHRRADPEPAAPACLPERHVLVVEVAHLPHGGPAVLEHPPDLARGQLDLDPAGILRQELRRAAGAANQLPPAAGLELDVVDRRAQRDLLQRERVPRQDVGVGARGDHLPDAEALRRDDVALLAVDVVQQRQARRAVRIVLDGRDAPGDAGFVPAEIDLPDRFLVSTPAVADGDPADVVPPAGALFSEGQRLERTLGGQTVLVTTPAKRRLGVVGRNVRMPMASYTASKYSIIFSPGRSVT
jgi:hypothetical protein